MSEISRVPLKLAGALTAAGLALTGCGGQESQQQSVVPRQESITSGEAASTPVEITEREREDLDIAARNGVTGRQLLDGMARLQQLTVNRPALYALAQAQVMGPQTPRPRVVTGTDGSLRFTRPLPDGRRDTLSMIPSTHGTTAQLRVLFHDGQSQPDDIVSYKLENKNGRFGDGVGQAAMRLFLMNSDTHLTEVSMTGKDVHDGDIAPICPFKAQFTNTRVTIEEPQGPANCIREVETDSSSLTLEALGNLIRIPAFNPDFILIDGLNRQAASLS